ncbi:MAG: pseudouridine synthase [Clostridiaceae bacterium]|nr:pseudouridine synthase [Clostridiaceae bacterium]
MRINKLLSNYGYCSRKEANKLIEEGRIYVNGKLCIPGQWVEESDHILLDNIKISKKPKVYIVLNKPIGVTCTADKAKENNIINYINYPEYIFAVGRLDKDSQGLIILTNDGELANNILEADNEHEKEYVVTLDKPFSNEFLEKMASGVDIGDAITKPCTVYRVNDCTYRIILTQGLNRQIRRMSKVLGYKVVKLKRIRIMNIYLNDLEYGKWREITENELYNLKKKL